MKTLLAPILFCLVYTTASAQKTVTITDNSFSPSSLTITPGTKVTWVNKSSGTQHTTTSGTGCKPDGKWNSGNLDPNGSFSHTFQTAGTYKYFCIPHCSVGMVGTIEVKGGGSEAPDEETQQSATGTTTDSNKATDEAPKAQAMEEQNHAAHEKKKMSNNHRQRARR